MGFRERAEAMAEARAEVHEEFKRPVMFSSDRGVNWRVVHFRVHENINPDGVAVNSGASKVFVDTDQPIAIVKNSEAADLVVDCILSVSDGVAYRVAAAPPADQFGYRKVRLKRDHNAATYPVPEWGIV